MYKNKYLKYKNKYLELKKIIGGTLNIEPNNERYINVNNFITQSFIDNFITQIAYEKYRYIEDGAIPIHDNKYDILKDPYLNINLFEDILLYFKKFIESNEEPYKYGIIFNHGPISFETTFIIYELLNFYKRNIVTLDSEIGCYDVASATIQKPYIYLFGDKNIINKIKDNIIEHKYIGYINYNAEDKINTIQNTLINLYETLSDNYSVGFFGIRNMNAKELNDCKNISLYLDNLSTYIDNYAQNYYEYYGEVLDDNNIRKITLEYIDNLKYTYNDAIQYFEYIFTNNFFHDLLNIIDEI